MAAAAETAKTVQVCKLTALVAAEHESAGAGGGWNEVLSGLKTLLETGSQLPFQRGPQKE